MAKIGDYQTASIPGRGQIFAKHAIEKWIREPRAKYFIKLDIRKFYPSIDQDVLRAMLARDVKNEALLYLVGVLLDQFPHGLNIGSFLSQYLANYYASRAYHYAQERLRKTRVNRRTGVVTDKRLVDHVLFYMDDILLMGHDKRDLKMAARRLSKFVKDELHVELKPWKVCAVDKEPLDMVGFVFYTYKTTIRPGIFLQLQTRLHARRAVGGHTAAAGPALHQLLRLPETQLQQGSHREISRGGYIRTVQGRREPCRDREETR